MEKDRNLLNLKNNSETFINTNVYLQYKYSRGMGSNLVHGRIAFEEIYDSEEYEIHHKNENKLENRPKIHYAKHFGTYQERQERERQLRINETLRKEVSLPVKQRSSKQKSLEESIQKPRKKSFLEQFLSFIKSLFYTRVAENLF
jgi:hypothetical protein